MMDFTKLQQLLQVGIVGVKFGAKIHLDDCRSPFNRFKDFLCDRNCALLLRSVNRKHIIAHLWSRRGAVENCVNLERFSTILIQT